MSKQNVRVTTPEGRLSYPALFEPKAFEGQEPRYGCEVILDGNADLKPLREACAAVLTRQFPDATKRPKVALPIKNGDEENKQRLADGKEPRPEIAGKWLVKARSKTPPALVDENVQPIMDNAKLFAGCVVRVSVSPFWYDKGVKKGLSFALNGVQFVRKDTPFGNPFDAEKAFAPVAGASQAQQSQDANPDTMFL